MTLNRFALAFGWSLLAASVASAQSYHLFGGEQHTAPWPASLVASGAFGRGTAARLTQASFPDAVVLRGKTPVVLVRPDQFLAASKLPISANDLTTLPGGAPSGLDAVAFVGSAGLTVAWFDAAQGAPVSSLVSSAAANGSLVRAGDVDGDGVLDLVVVEADGVTIRPYLGDGAGGFVPSAGFQAAAPCRNLVVLRWDADAGEEVAVLTDLGVELYDDGGAPLKSWPSAVPGGTLCKFSQQGALGDRLLWFTAYAPPAEQWMMTLSPAGVDDVVNLGALDAFAAVPVDYDLDGFEDVLVSHKYSHELLWFENQRSAANPTGPSFSAYYNDMIGFRVGPPGTGAPENAAWPIVADFDGDGDPDIVFPVELTDELAVLRGETIDQSTMLAPVSAANYDIDPATLGGVLQVTLDRPAALPATADAVEIEVWRQPDLAGPVDAHSVEHLVVALPPSWPLVVDVPLPEVDAEFTSTYHLQVRLLEHDAQGGVARAYPTQVASFALLAADVDTLKLDPTTVDTLAVPAPIPDSSGWSPSVVKRGRMNELPQDDAPVSQVVMF